MAELGADISPLVGHEAEARAAEVSGVLIGFRRAFTANVVYQFVEAYNCGRWRDFINVLDVVQNRPSWYLFKACRRGFFETKLWKTITKKEHGIYKPSHSPFSGDRRDWWPLPIVASSTPIRFYDFDARSR
jgi:hypothetical protein